MGISSKGEAKRSLFLVADNVEGGLGAAVLVEAEYFARRAWNVTIMAPNALDRSWEFPHLLAQGVEFADVNMPGATRQLCKGVKAGRDVVRHIRSCNAPTVIHCHGLRSSLFVRLARPAVPMAMTYHGGTVRSLARRLVMSTQAHACQLAISASPHPPRGFVFWPHASPFLQGSPRDALATDQQGELRVGWFGRLEPPKRPDLWLAAVLRARDLGVRVSGHVVGDGSLLEPLKESARKQGFPLAAYGAMPASEALRQMDVLLTWSDSDALAFTVQEAVWDGIPALSNDIPGPASILGDCAIGIIDEDSVVGALSQLEDSAVRIEAVQAQQAALLNVLQPGDPLPQVHAALERLSQVG